MIYALMHFARQEDGSDHELGAFIANLLPQSLKEFRNLSTCGIAKETCLALAQHSQSLRRLRLDVNHEDIAALALLRSCTNLSTLQLTISFTTEPLNQKLLGELSSWLAECKHLKELTMEEFEPAPTMLTPMLLSGEVQLEALTIKAKAYSNRYILAENSDFHHALAHQQNLQTLNLEGNGQDAERDDVEVLVTSMTSLRALRKLDLRGISDDFEDKDVIRILSQLHDLEEVYVGGCGVTDEVLDTVAELSNLRSMTFAAITAFTTAGLLDFISKLRPTNQGLRLSIFNADADNLLNDEELLLVRNVLFSQVGGKLDYVPLQGKARPSLPTPSFQHAKYSRPR